MSVTGGLYCVSMSHQCLVTVSVFLLTQRKNTDIEYLWRHSGAKRMLAYSVILKGDVSRTAHVDLKWRSTSLTIERSRCHIFRVNGVESGGKTSHLLIEKLIKRTYRVVPQRIPTLLRSRYCTPLSVVYE